MADAFGDGDVRGGEIAERALPRDHAVFAAGHREAGDAFGERRFETVS
jgi:hypothetical protein